MKYAHLEENTNRLLGWYDNKIHKTIPTPNIEVSDGVWQEAINKNANAYDEDTKSFIVKDFRTAEEISHQEQEVKIQEANSYLKETDWVETYKLRHDLGLELVPEESSKWVIINKREEYKLFLKNLEGGN